jgi:HK97 family phage prohead protease
MNEIERPENLSYKNAPIELKEDGDTRYIEAVFSLFETIDSDNDVTKANALRSGYSGNKVPLVWNHDWSKVIGRGIIETDNQKAVFKGYFLETEAGKEAYETVKAMQDMQQFSYGFQVMKSEKGSHIDSKGEEVPVRVLQDVKVWEVSPVLVGAQQNSFVQALKSGLEPYDDPDEKIDEIDTEFEEVKDDECIDEKYGKKKCTYGKDGKCAKDMNKDLEISSESDTGISKSSQQGMRLGEHAVASLEELKAFTERIEDLASLRNSEKKTLSQKSTEMVSTYIAGLNAIYSKLDDVVAQYGYDPVKDNELFIDVQKNIMKNN